LLQQVNRMMWTSTAPQHYATVLFARYDDSTRRLAYVNCGPNPPILLRHDGAVERLPPTPTVIGLFEPWQCTVPQVQLAPGDLLAVYSDGVTEATRDDEEFGEDRLIQELRAASRLPVGDIITAILTAVQQFTTGPQSDDLTLLIARARP
jgi:serine phosphatase RsbU (regulator of sigma subunit)